ncbi:MAG: VanW family protein, partial [Clostridia bacterium]
VALLFFIFKDKLLIKNDNSSNEMNNNVARLAQDSNVLGNNEKLNEVNNKVENILTNSSQPPKEEEIASYSTKLSGSTENRLTNIRITCKKLNGITVNNNDTFSFCKSTGPSTAEEGYKEATVFLNGKKVQALGGGNCQISSTLYNAVLTVPDFKVVERHEHGRDVSYVPDGKDAAVSYGSIDFKFKNNTGNNIKLYFSTDDVTLSVRIVKLV